MLWHSTSSSGEASTVAEYRRPFVACQNHVVEPNWNACVYIYLYTQWWNASFNDWVVIYIYVCIDNLLKSGGDFF